MNLSTNEIKKLLKKWHFYKAHTSTSDELSRKINAVEKAVAALGDVDGEIIRLKYFQGAEIDMVRSRVFLSRSVIYWHIDRAMREIAYFIANTV